MCWSENASCVRRLNGSSQTFVRACAASAGFVLRHQDAFAPGLGSSEIALLGKAIKYANLVGKKVPIIPSTRRPCASGCP